MDTFKKNTGLVGYAWVADHLGLPAFLGHRVARLSTNTGVTPTLDGGLLVPSRMAPDDTIVDQLLFALKNEGVDLYVLACGLKRVPQEEMQAAVDATPNGMYVRTAAYLWESLTDGTLALPHAVVLPISVAMQRHEKDYLLALTSFSKPAREFCDVRWASGEEYDFRWQANAQEAFQYMDLTAPAEFTLQMALVALKKDLLHETQWLMQFDHVYNQVKEQHDIRDADLSALITIAFHNGGVISGKKRKAYAERVPARVMDAIDEACSRCLQSAVQVSGSGDEDMPAPRM